MEVFAIFFSPTGNTREVVRSLAKGVSKVIAGRDFYSIDVTKESDRDGVYEFGPKDVVIVGMPTYAGRIPNKIEPYVSSSIYGKGALAVPVVTYGNRAFDDSLKELATILSNNEMTVCAGMAVPCEHAFSDALANGRPTQEDLSRIEEYGQKLGKKILEEKAGSIKVSDIPGHDAESFEYYKPLKENNEPASFLKAMPKTNPEKCVGCNECKEICPMGCFNESVTQAQGICIKCHGCIKVCPNGAKYFDDEDLSSHIRMLQNNYKDKRNEIFFL